MVSFVLALADSHDVFWESLLDFRCHNAEAQAALWCCDALIRSHTRRHAEKDLARLASSARAAARRPQPARCPRCLRGPGHRGVPSVFSAREAVSSAAAASASSQKPTATATLMSLVTRSSKASATDEDRELVALGKMEQLSADVRC